MLESILGGLLIFLLRLCDVPIGTLRTMLMVQGRRLPAVCLASIEAAIWVIAISRVFSGDLNSPFRIAGYALGFASGTALGMTAERWLAFGQALVRIISRTHSEALRLKLISEGFGVTGVEGRGRDGPVLILFVVTPRKRLRKMLALIRALDASAFITLEPVSQAIGGHFAPAATAAVGQAKR
jgi:uncharacterized protein YebE (UPF0316 family)